MPRDAPQYHWLLPISCHFQDCTIASGHESDSCRQRYSKYPTFTFTFITNQQRFKVPQTATCSAACRHTTTSPNYQKILSQGNHSPGTMKFPDTSLGVQDILSHVVVTHVVDTITKLTVLYMTIYNSNNSIIMQSNTHNTTKTYHRNYNATKRWCYIKHDVNNFDSRRFFPDTSLTFPFFQIFQTSSDPLSLSLIK